MASIDNTLAKTAPTQEPGQALSGDRLQDPAPAFIESFDTSWTEFCSTLQVPAFLLAVTGFGDL